MHQLPPNVLVQSKFHGQVGRYMGAAGYVVLLVDILLLLPEEIALVWKAKGNIAKWAYLVDRYGTFTFQTFLLVGLSQLFGLKLQDGPYCRIMSLLALWLFLPSIATSNLLVLLRAFRIWRNEPLIRFGILGLWLVTLIVTLVLFPVVHTRSAANPSAFWIHMYGDLCVIAGVDRSIIAGFAVSIAFDLSVVIASLWNCLHRIRDQNESLLVVIYQDGFYYFAAVFLLRLCSLVAIVTSPTEVMEGIVILKWTLITTLMGRFMIKLRRLNTEAIKDPKRTRRVRFSVASQRELVSYS